MSEINVKETIFQQHAKELESANDMVSITK